MPYGSILRCTGCNTKSHRMFWEEGRICPACERADGYKLSSHGGLTWEEILEVRSRLRETRKEIERSKLLTKPSPERHY